MSEKAKGEQPLPEKGVEELQKDPPPLLDKPWRVLRDITLEELKETVAKYTPVQLKTDPVSAVNILLMGPVGSGKSSFFNTVNSAFEDRVTFRANSGSLGHSVTLTYRKYTVLHPDSGLPMKFRICDTTGLTEDLGWDSDDYSAILKGYIGEGFKFSKSRPKWFLPTPSNANQNSLPAMDQRVHCLVIVLDSSTLESENETMLQKLKKIREKANEIDVPVAVLLTRVEQLDPRVGTDVSLVFRSPAVEQAVSRAARLVGVPRAHVLLVKNYESEAISVPELDKLALLSLRSMLRLADDFFCNFPHENPGPPEKPVEESASEPPMPPHQETITEPEPPEAEPPQEQGVFNWAVFGFIFVMVGIVTAYMCVDFS